VVAHQRSLFATGPPALDGRAPWSRTALDEQSWIDVRRGWLQGADDVLDQLIGDVAWRRGRRRMYDRVLDDPRLSRWYRADDPLPHPVLASARDALSAHYGVRFGPLGLNYYRDGNDSVAFHADRELRDLDDGLVAIVTLGACRRFLVRAKTGGRAIDVRPSSGDLVVMGGACQRRFEHAVPKLKTAGPRISATWRWSRTP
jgi:alkylated DNA repair dioxygenase AlkB